MFIISLKYNFIKGNKLKVLDKNYLFAVNLIEGYYIAKLFTVHAHFNEC